MTHELKILPEYFEAVTSGRKQFEIRKNDRDYKVGDLLILREHDIWVDEFTGNSYKAEITYITDYAQKDGYVVMGIIGIE
ncbi:ASCH/PUA domain-containing protein [Enterococcus hirae]